MDKKGQQVDMSKKDSSECVRVVIRCRPLSNGQKGNGQKSIVKVKKDCGEINVFRPNQEQPKKYTFDSVYDHSSTQKQIFMETSFPIIQNVLQGYNGTIFAYGQTGTGKTHTMAGIDKSISTPQQYFQERGIMPRSFETIFNSIQCGEGKQYLVRASYLEIYMENIHDLLSSDVQKKLDIRQNPDTGVFVKDLTSKTVKSQADVKKLLDIGASKRVTGETKMNERSSRSHALFQLIVECSEIGADLKQHIHMGKLNMVDLAGSERQSKTQASGERLKQGSSINLSLTTLCHVIKSLVDPNVKFIPYRNSRLTRLLQDSLGGNAKTVMIANIGPAQRNCDETLGTLRYASKAKFIINKATINQDPKDAKLREYQEEINMLKKLLEQRGLHKKAGSMAQDSGAGGQRGGGEGGQTKIVEIEEIQKVQNKEQIKKLEESLAQEKNQIRKKAEVERKKIMEHMDLADNQKKELLKQLEKKELKQKREKEKEQKMIKKIQKMESILVEGSKFVEQAKRQELRLQQADAQIQEKERKKKQMQRLMKTHEEVVSGFEQKFSSIQEQLEQKTIKIQEIQDKYEEANQQVQELKEQFHNEREDMIQTIKQLTKELKGKNLVVDSFIPGEELLQIEHRAIWNQQYNEWFIPHLEYAGNNITYQDDDPVQRKKNKKKIKKIKHLELGFDDDEELQYMPFQTQPGVYYKYTEDGLQREEINLNNPKNRKKKQSATEQTSKRPFTSKKKKKTDILNGNIVSMVENMSSLQAGATAQRITRKTHTGQENMFPKAKGLKL